MPGRKRLNDWFIYRKWSNDLLVPISWLPVRLKEVTWLICSNQLAPWSDWKRSCDWFVPIRWLCCSDWKRSRDWLDPIRWLPGLPNARLLLVVKSLWKSKVLTNIKSIHDKVSFFNTTVYRYRIMTELYIYCRKDRQFYGIVRAERQQIRQTILRHINSWPIERYRGNRSDRQSCGILTADQ